MAATVPQVLSPPKVQAARPKSQASARHPLIQAFQRTIRNPMGMFGITVVCLLALAALTAPWIAPYDPIEQHPGSELRPPSGLFWLGTDNLGRDLLSRI